MGGFFCFFFFFFFFFPLLLRVCSHFTGHFVDDNKHALCIEFVDVFKDKMPAVSIAVKFGINDFFLHEKNGGCVEGIGSFL